MIFKTPIKRNWRDQDKDWSHFVLWVNKTNYLKIIEVVEDDKVQFSLLKDQEVIMEVTCIKVTTKLISARLKIQNIIFSTLLQQGLWYMSRQNIILSMDPIPNKPDNENFKAWGNNLEYYSPQKIEFCEGFEYQHLTKDGTWIDVTYTWPNNAVGAQYYPSDMNAVRVKALDYASLTDDFKMVDTEMPRQNLEHRHYEMELKEIRKDRSRKGLEIIYKLILNSQFYFKMQIKHESYTIYKGICRNRFHLKQILLDTEMLKPAAIGVGKYKIGLMKTIKLDF